ncbi:MAG: hypothetical protein ACYDCO_18075 [Armatimonadota bacterium]
MLRSRIEKLEALLRRRRRSRVIIVYENDWRDDRPSPTSEELAAPDTEVIHVRYVNDWPTETGDFRGFPGILEPQDLSL